MNVCLANIVGDSPLIQKMLLKYEKKIQNF